MLSSTVQLRLGHESRLRSLLIQIGFFFGGFLASGAFWIGLLFIFFGTPAGRQASIGLLTLSFGLTAAVMYVRKRRNGANLLRHSLRSFLIGGFIGGTLAIIFDLLVLVVFLALISIVGSTEGRILGDVASKVSMVESCVFSTAVAEISRMQGRPQ